MENYTTKMGICAIFACVAALIFLPGCLAVETFYETFDSAESVADNHGNISGSVTFVPGIANNAINLSDASTAKVAYPRPGAMSRGTVELWFNAKAGFSESTRGFFDVGRIGSLTSNNELGIYWNNRGFFVFEISGQNGWWSQRSVAYTSEPGWHHLVAVWSCNNSQGDYAYVYLDGQKGQSINQLQTSCNLLLNTSMWAGASNYGGISKAYIDELKVWDYPKTQTQILEENAPSIVHSSPDGNDLLANVGETIQFRVDVTDPHGYALETVWLLNGNPNATGLEYNLPVKAAGTYDVVFNASNGPYSAARSWRVVVSPNGIMVINGSIYINSTKFLVKGIDYAPWLYGTGPNPTDAPFPGEFDDVTGKVTFGGVTFVKDYSGDGKIQSREVIQHDLEVMKSTGANTIRTYASGYWHDKDLDGVVDESPIPEESEIVKGDMPDWMIAQIVEFAEQNNMKVFLGYWVQEETFESYPSESTCDWDDLEVAKTAFGRIVADYTNSPAVIGWSIGNEVHGDWNQWFNWGVDIDTYLNSLYAHVRTLSAKPILYAKFYDETVYFSNLEADILGPQAYTHPASEMVTQFSPAPPPGKAYLMAEYGHIIEQAKDQWDLAKQYAGGCFLEYNDVWWKGDNQDVMGIVEEYRDIKHERYDVVAELYGALVDGCNASTPCAQAFNDAGTVKYCRNMSFGYLLYSAVDVTPYCNDTGDKGNLAYCGGTELVCDDTTKWKSCNPTVACATSYAVGGVAHYCRDFGSGYKWYTAAEATPYCNADDDIGKTAYCGGTQIICDDNKKWKSCGPTVACATAVAVKGVQNYCRDFGGSVYKWYTAAQAVPYCNGTEDRGNLAHCGGTELVCDDNTKWKSCGPTVTCATAATVKGAQEWCRNINGKSWVWTPCLKCAGKGCATYPVSVDYPLGTKATCEAKTVTCTTTGWM